MNVLVLRWSLTGEQAQASDTFVAPFRDAGHHVVVEDLRPLAPFPFPWTVARFFGLFPETVLERPEPIAPLTSPKTGWDLVILGAQVWFMSPSMPVAALLHGPDRDVFEGARVLTLVTARNMWVAGWRKIVARVEDAGGRVTDRVVATHGGVVLKGYFATLFFQLSGKRDQLGQKAGIPPETFDRLARQGREASEKLWTARPDEPLLPQEGTAFLSPPHAVGEQIVSRIFPWIARAAAATSAPGSALRTAWAWFVLTFVVSSIFGFLVPCFSAYFLARRWIDPWLAAQGRLPVRNVPPRVAVQ